MSRRHGLCPQLRGVDLKRGLSWAAGPGLEDRPIAPSPSHRKLTMTLSGARKTYHSQLGGKHDGFTHPVWHGKIHR